MKKKREIFQDKKYIGKKYNMLTVIKFTDIVRVKNGYQFFRLCICRCDCGSRREYYWNNVKQSLSQSCGCKPPNIKTHRLSGHPLYSRWSGIMGRCYNPEDTSYKNYGSRGIDVYMGWHNVENFVKDVEKILGDKILPGHSLDRIDNNRGYYPDNIRWATQKEQMNNTRYSDALTAGKLAGLTGYTRERVRQLTYPTTSSPRTKNFPLKDFIDEVIRISEDCTHYIYKPSAIKFLKNKRNKLNRIKKQRSK